jgi:hypothetical protein
MHPLPSLVLLLKWRQKYSRRLKTGQELVDGSVYILENQFIRMLIKLRTEGHSMKCNSVTVLVNIICMNIYMFKHPTSVSRKSIRLFSSFHGLEKEGKRGKQEEE